MSTADDLEQAADILETEGWTKYVFTDGQSFCALGALSKAVQGGVYSHLNPRVMVAVTALGFTHAAHLGAWSDSQESAAPVIELFKRTAKDLRNRAEPVT